MFNEDYKVLNNQVTNFLNSSPTTLAKCSSQNPAN